LEAVPVGVFEAHEDYPGVSSPKKGGVHVATANLAQYSVVISFGANMFDWDGAAVTDLQKSKWVFADVREMRKIRAPYICYVSERRCLSLRLQDSRQQQPMQQQPMQQQQIAVHQMMHQQLVSA
jgi:hypothetical protein